MNPIKKIFHNSGIIVIGNFIDVIFSLIIAVLLAKYYGQSGFGIISFLGIFLFFLGTLDSLWIRPILIREISRDDDRAGILIGNGMMMRGIFTAVTLILFWVTVRLVGAPREIIPLVFLSSCNMILGSFIFSFETILRSYLKMIYFVKSKLVSNIFTIASIYFIILLKGSLFHFFLASIISSVLLLWMIKSYSEKLLKPSFRIDFELWRKIFTKGWFLGLSALFIFIYHRIDQIMLFRMHGPGMTGLYAAGVRLVEGLNVIPLALMSSLLPFMSLYAVSSPELFRKSYRLSFKYLLIVTVPLAVGTTIFSQAIISFFYGNQYASAGLALSILIWAEIFVFLGIVNNTILVAANQQFLDPIFTGGSAVINVFLNFILIPKYGLGGAALASLVAYATGPVMGYFISKTRDYSRTMFYYSLKPLCASLIMFSLNYYFHFSLGISLVFSPFIYFLALYFLKGFDKEDRRILWSIFTS